MQDAARSHHRIAQSIRDLVINPFSRWCDAHETRIQDSQDDLQARLKAHDRQAEAVKKLRSVYFNKCRLLEDLEEENKLGFQEPESSPQPGQGIPEIKVQEEEPEEDEEVYEIGDEVYQPEQLKKILAHMLSTIKMGEHKVAILGTYQNVSAGSDIVEYIQEHMKSSSVSYTERIGQDLVSNGFLRLIGNVGSVFANSSRMFYQWRPKAFQMAGIPEKKVPLNRTFSMPSTGSESGDNTPVFGTVGEYLANWNVINSRAHPDETPRQRLQREANEADNKYKAGVRRLDELRCDLEEAIFVHLKYLERCEFDRLKAIKTVILDFSGTIGNVIPSLQSTVDKMMLFQETIQPQGDLRYFLETYRTGSFVPKVVVYENYYHKADEQTFGVDLEARARADKKRVPTIVTTILTYLDHRYPDLEGDEARQGVWLVEVPLNQVHKLRAVINNGKPFNSDMLNEFDVPTVAALLKLYLLELPGKNNTYEPRTEEKLATNKILDSLVSSHVYEIIRTIYNNPTADGTEASRVSVLQHTLAQLRLSNIATLDACMNHFTRLIDLTSADETYVTNLATSISSSILRPRTETSLTLEEKHAYKLVRDLFAHKDAIFSELKRMSSLNHSSSVGGSGRSRAISTDESNRKALMEERQRALVEKANANRSRATSPNPGARGHRRDRSSGGPETRFPIQTSPTSSTDRARSSLGNMGTIANAAPTKRSSLEVPGDSETPNGSTDSPTKSIDSPTTSDKRDSVPGARTGAKFVGGRRITVSSPSLDSPTRGVTLEDRPME